MCGKFPSDKFIDWNFEPYSQERVAEQEGAIAEAERQREEHSEELWAVILYEKRIKSKP